MRIYSHKISASKNVGRYTITLLKSRLSCKAIFACFGGLIAPPSRPQTCVASNASDSRFDDFHAGFRFIYHVLRQGSFPLLDCRAIMHRCQPEIPALMVMGASFLGASS